MFGLMAFVLLMIFAIAMLAYALDDYFEPKKRKK